MRGFLESLEAWKDLDRARLMRSLDAPYAECYALCVSLRETENALSLSIASLDHDHNTVADQSAGDGDDGGGGDLRSVRAMLAQAEHRCERMREAMRQLVRQNNHGTGPTPTPSKRMSSTSTTSQSQSQPSSQSQSPSQRQQSNNELLQLQSRWEEIHAQIHAAHAATKAAAAQSQTTNTALLSDGPAAGANAPPSAPLSSLLPAAASLPLPLHPHLLALLHGPSPAAAKVPANHLLAVRRTLDRLTALGALPPAPTAPVEWPELLSEASMDGLPLAEPLFAVGDQRHHLLHTLMVDPNHRLPSARRLSLPYLYSYS